MTQRQTLPCDRIDRVGTPSDICDGPAILFFHRVVREGLAISMLAIPDRLGNSVFEADHVMLPISHMGPDFLPKDGRCFVIRIEIEVKHVRVSASMIAHHNN